MRAKADRSRAERTRLARDEALDEQLIALARRRDPVTGAPLPVQLFEFDPAAYGGDGVAVVSVGDLDTADNVGVIVPGMGTTVSSIATLGPSAARLYSAARTSAPAETDATVVWIGYDAPSGPRALAQVVTSERARRGGDELRADLRDIAAMRGARDPHLVVFAHSYGSTTMGYAGAGGALAPVVDSVVLLGSPGAGPVRTAGSSAPATACTWPPPTTTRSRGSAATRSAWARTRPPRRSARSDSPRNRLRHWVPRTRGTSTRAARRWRTSLGS
ncbi:alpha/beta hydrolase [Tsukamurella soli]|uniref:alpha/beta hydrolase n=1 Tax=Tsukamurella soli TaxID=644556 RepID=UPI00360A88A3